jgi:hypothetical protein
MKIKSFDEIPLYDLGNRLEISGMILQGADETYAIMFPYSKLDEPTMVGVNEQEWKDLLYQLDTLGAVLYPNKPGAKTVVRKSQRQLDSKTNWKVFRRDNFTCQYCGVNDVPMTVDHIVLWEDMGDSVEDNMICACSNCNKKRGNMEYEDWLQSDYLLNKVKNNFNFDYQINILKSRGEKAKLTPLRSSNRNR